MCYQLINACAGGCLSVTCAHWADLSDFEVKEDVFFQVNQNWMVNLGTIYMSTEHASLCDVKTVITIDARVMFNSLCGIRYVPSCTTKTTASD